MVKRIIILALCFMVYIIINIDTVTAARPPRVSHLERLQIQQQITNRRNEFNLLVKCYRQMFNNGLIKGIARVQRADDETFQRVMGRFYTHILGGPDTEPNGSGDLVPKPKYEKFKTDALFGNMKNKYLDAFMRWGTDNQFQTLIDTFKSAFSAEDYNYYPLTLFASRYDPNSNTEWFKTPREFCKRYSENFNFYA